MIYSITSGVKSILKLYLSKSIVTYSKTTRNKIRVTRSFLTKSSTFYIYGLKILVLIIVEL